MARKNIQSYLNKSINQLIKEEIRINLISFSFDDKTFITETKSEYVDISLLDFLVRLIEYRLIPVLFSKPRKDLIPDLIKLLSSIQPHDYRKKELRGVMKVLIRLISLYMDMYFNIINISYGANYKDAIEFLNKIKPVVEKIMEIAKQIYVHIPFNSKSSIPNNEYAIILSFNLYISLITGLNFNIIGVDEYDGVLFSMMSNVLYMSYVPNLIKILLLNKNINNEIIKKSHERIIEELKLVINYHDKNSVNLVSNWCTNNYTVQLFNQLTKHTQNILGIEESSFWNIFSGGTINKTYQVPILVKKKVYGAGDVEPINLKTIFLITILIIGICIMIYYFVNNLNKFEIILNKNTSTVLY